jgi:RNA polymerase sigma factor (sigma-70 family)
MMYNPHWDYPSFISHINISEHMNDTETNFLPSRSALLGYIRRKVSDPDLAEDILQESLLKALRASPELRDDQKFVPWLYRIINNAITDLYRRRQVENRYLAEIAHDPEETVEQEERRAICQCIKDVIPSLKPEYAALIEALELGDDDPEVVADRLGISRNNLKVRRHRARTQLRERLEQTCRSCATHGCLDCSCKRH